MTSTLAQQKSQYPEWLHWLLLSRNIFENRFPEMDLRPPKKIFIRIFLVKSTFMYCMHSNCIDIYLYYCTNSHTDSRNCGKMLNTMFKPTYLRFYKSVFIKNSCEYSPMHPVWILWFLLYQITCQVVELFVELFFGMYVTIICYIQRDPDLSPHTSTCVFSAITP